jgi:hypothetical protein
MHTHFGDIASLLGRPTRLAKIATLVRTPAARRIEPVFAPPAPARRNPAQHASSVALAAANFTAMWQMRGFPESFEAAAGQLRPRASDGTPARDAGGVLTATGIARPLKPGSPAAESMRVMKKLRGEI